MKSTMKIILTMPTLFFCITTHAGDMNPAHSVSGIAPYVNIEASYTWNQMNGLSLNSHTAQLNKQGWGGRFSGGISYPVGNNLSLTTELGGGYYGQVKLRISRIDYASTINFDGYDLLLGAKYKLNQFEWLAGVGFMIENERIHMLSNTAQVIPGGLDSGSMNVQNNTTQVLPEIKVGAIYNLNNNWGVSLNYLHVFGANNQGSEDISASPTSFSKVVNANYQNPTFDSIMFGLRHNFA